MIDLIFFETLRNFLPQPSWLLKCGHRPVGPFASNMQMSGNPDVDFAMMMRNHHLSGIKMAEMQLRDGKEPKMRKMAKSIIAEQKKEIAKFVCF